MKKGTGLLMVFTVALLAMLVSNGITAEAKTNEKIYRTYDLPKEKAKFPMKLSNSLVIDYKEAAEDMPSVLIKKDGRIIWEGWGANSYASIQFTVTKNNDTYMAFKWDGGGSEVISMIGVSGKGKLFMDKTLDSDGAAVFLDFLTPSFIELSVEEYDHLGVSTGGIGNKYSGILKTKFYQLYANGSMKESAYFDSTFISLAKNGQLKWVSGQLDMPFSKLKPAVAGLPAYQDFGSDYNLYATWKAAYGFYYDKNYSKTIKSNAKVRSIVRTADVYGTKKTLQPFFRKHFGKEILSYDNHYYAYKAGKYYLTVQYMNNGTVHISLTADRPR